MFNPRHTNYLAALFMAITMGLMMSFTMTFHHSENWNSRIPTPSSYIGGVIASHLEHNENFFRPIAITSLVWITPVIRFPELLLRFNVKTGHH